MAVLSERLKNFTGLVSSADVIFKDNTCREIDEEAMVKMWKYLIDLGCSAIMPYEEPQTLTREERTRLIDLLVETCKGTDCVVMDHGWADSTRAAIEDALIAKEHGVEVVLLPPPNIPGYHGNRGPHYLAHYKKFSEATDMPFILMGGNGLFGNCHMKIDAYVEIITKVENCWGCKITAPTVPDYIEYMKAVKAARPETRVLKAGSFGCGDFYLAGGDGNLSGQLSMAQFDCKIHQLWKEGKLEECKELSDKVTPLGMLPYTYDVNAEVVPFFETNFKAMSWMLGLIDVPGMRLPYVPTPLDRMQVIYDELVRQGLDVKRKPVEEWPLSEV